MLLANRNVSRLVLAQKFDLKQQLAWQELQFLGACVFSKKLASFFNERRLVIECTVRNLSAVGALLLLPSTVGVPNEFEFWIDDAFHTTRIIRKDHGRIAVAWNRYSQSVALLMDGQLAIAWLTMVVAD